MTGNPDVKFMHCLPAFQHGHRGGQGDLREPGLEALEVTEEVFEFAGFVFDEAEEPHAHDQGRHGGHHRELRVRVVVALGGNALLRRRAADGGEPGHAQRACGGQAVLIALEHELVISHGNGPQVGLLALQAPRTPRSTRTRSTCSAPRPRG